VEQEQKIEITEAEYNTEDNSVEKFTEVQPVMETVLFVNNQEATQEEYDAADPSVRETRDVPKTEVVLEPVYKTRFLDADGNIITETEYTTLINASQTAYKAAFVGCTYHCG